MTATPGSPPRARRPRALAGLRYGLVLAVLFGLWLPLVQQRTGLLREWPLRGVEANAKPVALTWRTWRDGSYAKAYEACFNQNFGGRSMVVRLANQFRYEAFGQPPRSAGTPVTIGREGWLYENAYVHDYLGTSKRPAPDAGIASAEHLRKLHAALTARGIGFVVVISPSKPGIYPEHLPASLPPPKEGALQSPYERVAPRLRAAGLPLVDAQALFLQWKHQRPEPLFAPTGTHWNFTAAYLVLERVLETWRQQLGDRVPRPALEGVTLGPPRGADDDLARLLNLFRFVGGATQQVPFPTIRPDSGATVRPLRVGLVGDSFSFTLIDALALSGSASDVSFLYYARRRYDYALDPRNGGRLQDHASHEGAAFDPATFDWTAWLLACDAVLVEANAIMLHDGFWGFAEQAQASLDSE